jgi:hypothetical protein
MISHTVSLQKIKVSFAVFCSISLLSFAVFSMADDQNTSSKNIFIDTDQDGLSNDEEKLYGTNHLVADTDSDGYSDGTEVKSGYDPLKKAPGDKIVSLNDVAAREDQAMTQIDLEKETNLTQAVSKEVATALKESVSKKENLSLDDLQSTIEKAMSAQTGAASTTVLPEIDMKSIKIKKQSYKKLSDTDRTAKIKEDTMSYVSAVSYILVNNSPVSLQVDSDMQKLGDFATQNAMMLLMGGNNDLLNDLAAKGDVIIEQLHAMEVPENMLDLHVKALRLAQYASSLKTDIASSSDNDPLKQINSLAKVQGLMVLFSDFASGIRGTIGSDIIPS